LQMPPLKCAFTSVPTFSISGVDIRNDVMTFKFLKIIGIGFILSVSTLANATLIDNGDYTTDTESGLDWLDWTETMNDTQAEALLEFSGDGWRIASASEAQDLIENHFGVGFGSSTWIVKANIVDWAIKYGSFSSMFGSTSPDYSYATIVGAGRFGAQDGWVPGISANEFPFIYGGIDHHDNISGVALVKATTVTEPAIITIFALGFAGIGFARRRQS
jgi:hypothetical protein